MKSITKIIPRYAETDQMGIIHHSVYPIWFEQGRTDFCNQIGFPFHEIEKQHIHLALVELHVEYKSPARYGDELILYTYIKQMKQVKIEFAYEIYNKDILISKGFTLLAWLDDNLRPMAISKMNQNLYDTLYNAIKE